MESSRLLVMSILVITMTIASLGQTVTAQNDTETACGCVNGICYRKNDSSVSCICDSHWEGENCDKEKPRCDEDPCQDVNADCTNRPSTLVGYRCDCKAGFYLDDDGKCKEYKLWTGAWTESHTTRPAPSEGIINHHVLILSSPEPIPFFSFSSLYVSMYDRGYIRLGEDPNNSEPANLNRYVTSGWSAWPFYIAPYYSDFNYGLSNSGSVYYSKAVLYGDTERNMTISLLNYAKNVIQTEAPSTGAQFEPVRAYSVTWRDVLPRSCSQASCTQSAFFQMVLATDLQFTYAIITWQNLFSRTELAGEPEVVAGHSNPEGGFVPLTPEPKTRKVIPLFSSGQPTSKPMECVSDVLNFKDGKDISALIQCPCQEKDAQLDFRFMHNSAESTSDRNAYEAKFFIGGFKQVCHYDNLGFFISNPTNVGLPAEQNPSSPSLVDIKNSCCGTAPALCAYFLRQFPTCRAGDTPLLKIARGGSAGTLQMTTFDMEKFTFNGWGEYILLQTGDIELQARTHRKGNGSTTYFSAYALKPSAAEDSARYQIYIKTDGALDGAWTQGTDLGQDVFKIDNTKANTLTITMPGMKLEVNRIPDNDETNSYSNSLTHTITLPAEAVTMGLSGNSDPPQHSNKALPPAPQDTEEWRVASNNQSLFDYTKPSATTFDEVNVHNEFEPQGLPSEPAQVLALFTNETKKNQAVELCGQDLFCVQEFYLFENQGGTAAYALERGRQLKQMVDDLAKAPPKLQELGFNEKKISPSEIANNVTLELKMVSPTSSGVTFALEGMFSQVEGISLDGNKLKLAGLNMTTLRSMKYPQSLSIIATDPNTNLSAVFWPKLFMCLCENDDQCLSYGYDIIDVDGQVGPTGNIIEVGCECDRSMSHSSRATGRYCDQELDVCVNCFNASACDSSKTTNYCAPCPEHTQGNGYLCRDIDECGTNNGGCEQICTNTDFGANCSCHDGYNVNGSMCYDINECTENLDVCVTSTKYCFNTPGSYECRCYGNGIGPNCLRAPYVYSLNIELAPISGQRWNDISGTENEETKKKLEGNLQSAVRSALVKGISSLHSDDLIVEVAELSRLQQRSRRAVERLAEISATVVVRSTKPVEESQMTAALDLAGCEANCPMEMIYVSSPPEMQSDTGLCSIPSVNTCDAQTTLCTKVADNRIMCECLPGFETAQDPNFCQDINECKMGANSCVNKNNCSNTFGSYMCACNSGHIWDHSSKSCTADACQSNPCQENWECDLTDSGTSYVCSPKSGNLNDDDDDEEKWRTALIVVACVLGFLCLCLIIAVICLCVRRRKTLEMDAYSNSRYNDLAANKRTSATEMSEQRNRRNLYEVPGRNGSYDNRSYSNDRL